MAQNLSSAALVIGALRVKVMNDIILSMALVNIKENCRFFQMRKNSIGIRHVFSCINICHFPRKLYGHEAL